MSTFEHYRAALATWPKSGSGRRLVHRHVLRVARLSRLAGIPAEEAAQEICAAMSERARSPKPGEITDALELVWNQPLDRLNVHRSPDKTAQPIAFETFKAYARDGVEMGFSEDDLRAPDPLRMPGAEGGFRIDWEPDWRDAVAFVHELFRPGDRVLCLPRKDSRVRDGDVRERDDWIDEFARRGQGGSLLPCLIAPNPVKPASGWGLSPTTGLPSPRVKDSVAAFRHLVLDRDCNPLRNRDLACRAQLAFLGGWGKRHGWNRVRAVVHTGNKSLHTILDVSAQDQKDWDEHVAKGLLSEFVRMGFDGSFANPAQMCRLPGAWRWLEEKDLEESDREADGSIPDTNRWKQQRLLFLRGGGR